MKVLVTGGAGSIGYHLVKRLVQNAANEVVGLDNINNYYDPDLKYARLKDTCIEKDEIKRTHSAAKHELSELFFVKMDLTDKVPYSEDDRADTPVSLYAATKKSN
jgi:UDP-glucuronate 4-epimerase